jgi:hypothetical protein
MSGNSGGDVDCWLDSNGGLIFGSDREITLDSPVTDIHDGGSTTYYVNQNENCTTEQALDVTAGTYVITLRTDAGVNVGIWNAALIVEWLPFDGLGNDPMD